MNQEHAQWDAEHEEIATLIRDIPTPKTNSFDEFMVHMRYILQYRNLFDVYYQQQKWRALHWCTWIKQQKAYHKLISEFTGTTNSAFNNNVVIAYGAGTFAHNSPSSPSIPNKQLQIEFSK